MPANQWVFTATDGTNGTELWVTDGTAAGTQLLKDIWSGISSSAPTGLTDLGNGRMLFAATGDNSNTGRELWITDGTSAGTVMLKDIFAGATGSSPANFIRLAPGKILFSTTTNSSNGVLWLSDGTANGTVQVENIFGASNGNNLGQMTVLDSGRVVFTAYDYGAGMGNVIWVSDGTAAGTFLLKSFGYSGGAPSGLTALGNGRMVFSAYDSTNGVEVWVTDGTAEGTTLVEDIRPGSANFAFTSAFNAIGNGKAIFRANDGSNGDELWVTDGTAAGTLMLADIAAGSNGSNPAYLFALGNGRALFAASNGTSYGQLWITDGTSAGTTLLKDFNVGLNSAPSDFFRLPDGRVLFSAVTTAQGRELWITDGTVDGTVIVADAASGSGSSNPTGFALLDSTHVVYAGAGNELWISDGTAAGTRLVVDLTPGFNSDTYPTNFTSLGNGLVTFTPTNGTTTGKEIWVTDGTAAGTHVLVDIVPGAGTSNPGGLILLNHEFPVTGTTGNDVLIGDGNANLMSGLAGSDRLEGRLGRDTLNGGGGADTLLGSAGNDLYIVDNSRDVVSETTVLGGSNDAGGIDTVRSGVSFSLATDAGTGFVERLTLTGTLAIDATGNALANLINGNNAANRITGGGGADTLAGVAGADTMQGGDGNDVLRGGTGADVIAGGAGADVFDYNRATESGPLPGERDLIEDFVSGVDRIDLSGIDANTTSRGNAAFGATFVDAFSAPGQLRFDAAAHVLYGNTDADADAEFALVLNGVTSLTAADLVL